MTDEKYAVHLLLLPALSRTKEASKRAACLNNVRQLSLATALHANDHQDALPSRDLVSGWPGPLKRILPNDQVMRWLYRASTHESALRYQFRSG